MGQKPGAIINNRARATNRIRQFASSRPLSPPASRRSA